MASDRVMLQLEGYRARFQRLRDARMFTGWILRSKGTALTVQAAPGLAIQIDEEFTFEVHALDRRHCFRAVLSDAGNDLYDFTATTQVSYIRAQDAARRMTREVKAFFKVNDAEVECDLTDVSLTGMAITCEHKIEKNQVISFLIETPLGPVECEGTVRNIRQLSEEPESWRVGILLHLNDRLSQGRWNRMVTASQLAA